MGERCRFDDLKVTHLLTSERNLHNISDLAKWLKNRLFAANRLLACKNARILSLFVKKVWCNNNPQRLAGDYYVILL